MSKTFISKYIYILCLQISDSLYYDAKDVLSFELNRLTIPIEIIIIKKDNFYYKKNERTNKKNLIMFLVLKVQFNLPLVSSCTFLRLLL